MSFDLQGVRTATVINPMAVRQHAIYIDAQRSDRKVQKARNIADLLERGQRARGGEHTALLIDVVT
jgi:hypothetical protein